MIMSLRSLRILLCLMMQKSVKIFTVNTKTGVGVDINLERPYVKLGLGVDYEFIYSKYTNNTEQDDVQHNLDFDLNFLSKYEQGIVGDRVKFHVRDVLSN